MRGWVLMRLERRDRELRGRAKANAEDAEAAKVRGGKQATAI